MKPLLWLFFCLFGSVCYAEIVRYPAVADVEDYRSVYPLALLELALARSGREYQLQSSAERMSKSRSMMFLKEQSELDILWTMTSVERELDLLPIRIPIFKGLSGYRVMLIKQQHQAKFGRNASAAQIKKLVYAQGHDWIDSKILTLNGFSVIGAAHYDNLFSMLEKGRVDAVPRNALEIADEAQVLAHRSIVIESNWVIYYPTASYFFVNPANKQLAKDLETGLRKTIADGSFEQLFQQFFSAHLTELKLKERNIIHLNNPLLPAETPVNEPQLWYHQR
ncbi:MAG TPA: hypothetical protein VIN66_16145 [Rheinheimera sp.]|uniref:hypothetical protein n=1 Tax=Rheinheimera sp. TaxID=1869214 RepID=UPI002F94BAEE